MTEINQHLRAHVTRVSFDLSLAKSHIAALVYIEQVRLAGRDAARVDRSHGADPAIRRANAHFVSGARGLQERGLVTHTPPKTPVDSRVFTDSDGTWHFFWDHNTWRITKAGRLVINLLKECGIYAEFAEQLTLHPAKKAAS